MQYIELINTLLRRAREIKASDVHLSESGPVVYRVNGVLYDNMELPGSDMRELIFQLLDARQRALVEEGHDADLALSPDNLGRFRVNVYHYSGGLAATIRVLNDSIPTLAELKLPEVLSSLADEPRGLILVTGPTGSGKSTTLASMVQRVNETRSQHIITIEDPIEYVYAKGRALIHQREVGRDTQSFASALRSALREDPDVILVGEMRDYETISAAATAAETGHLVLSTLHTTGAAQTIDRIIDACPAATQNQMRVQLAGVLKAVITQCLLPIAGGGGRCPATELLICNEAVQNMIRENKCHQLSTAMQSGAAIGMHTLNSDLMRLIRRRMITTETAMSYSNNRKELAEMLGI